MGRAREIHTSDGAPTTHELGLLLFREHAAICVEHQGRHLNALPFSPPRLTDSFNRRLYDVRVEARMQAIGPFFEVLDPGTFKGTLAESGQGFCLIGERRCGRLSDCDRCDAGTVHRPGLDSDQ